MTWIHINKYGVNEVFDAEVVRTIGFVRDGGSTGVELLYVDHNMPPRLITSEELAKNADKCHSLMRDLAEKLGAQTIVSIPLKLVK